MYNFLQVAFAQKMHHTIYLHDINLQLSYIAIATQMWPHFKQRTGQMRLWISFILIFGALSTNWIK